MAVAANPKHASSPFLPPIKRVANPRMCAGDMVIALVLVGEQSLVMDLQALTVDTDDWCKVCGKHKGELDIIRECGKNNLVRAINMVTIAGQCHTTCKTAHRRLSKFARVWRISTWRKT
jgi:hypothetical protein